MLTGLWLFYLALIVPVCLNIFRSKRNRGFRKRSPFGGCSQTNAELSCWELRRGKMNAVYVELFVDCIEYIFSILLTWISEYSISWNNCEICLVCLVSLKCEKIMICSSLALIWTLTVGANNFDIGRLRLNIIAVAWNWTSLGIAARTSCSQSSSEYSTFRRRDRVLALDWILILCWRTPAFTTSRSVRWREGWKPNSQFFQHYSRYS